MAQTTVGKILLKHSVPDVLKQHVAENMLDKKGINHLFNTLASHSPEDYKDAVTKLARLGFEVSTREGSTVSLTDLITPVPKDKYFDQAEVDVSAIKAGVGTKLEKNVKIADVYSKLTDRLQKEIIEEGLKHNHTLAKVILAGSRGSPAQYRQTVAAPVLVNDERGRPLLDFPVRNSFAEGLSIPEYLAHSYGTRQGTVATKLAVADSGYFSKQLARAAMTTRVVEHDCNTDKGITLSSSDRDSVGTFLAMPFGKYKRNNEVTPSVLSDLRSNHVGDIVIRSPMTCESSKHHEPYSVCQLCVGRRERGTLPNIGEYVGVSAATGLGEPLAQGQLNTKHSSSAAVLGKTVASGFKLIDQLANIPSTFRNVTAPLADIDGTITKVKVAPQGGHYVTISDGVKHNEQYVQSGMDLLIAHGQNVEAGDQLAEGLVNPEDVVKHKGIGEGRKYFVDIMRKTFDDAGMNVNRRNFELIAKNAVDHVLITHPDGIGDYLPNSIVSYQSIAKDYVARPDAKVVRTDLARGKYLEEPVLHYTIGTRLSSKMLEHIKSQGIQAVKVHDNPPGFQPEMQRMKDVPGFVPDWAHQLYSDYIERKLVNAVNTGMQSSLKGPSPILGLAHSVKFGLQ